MYIDFTNQNNEEHLKTTGRTSTYIVVVQKLQNEKFLLYGTVTRRLSNMKDISTNMYEKQSVFTLLKKKGIFPLC